MTIRPSRANFLAADYFRRRSDTAAAGATAQLAFVYRDTAEIERQNGGVAGRTLGSANSERNLDLNAAEQKALVAFLRSLTDRTVGVDVPRLP